MQLPRDAKIFWTFSGYLQFFRHGLSTIARLEPFSCERRAIFDARRTLTLEWRCQCSEQMGRLEWRKTRSSRRRRVAQELRCSKAHVYNVIRGKVDGVSPLPVITMGRRCLIRRSTLDTWMEQNESVADLQRPNEPCIE